MARYNEILVGRFARGVQKLFGIKGEVPIGSLAGELVVSHNLQSGRENRYIEGWNSFFFRTAIAAGGAGNVNGIQLRNPAGSNVIAVIEKISYTCGAGVTGSLLLSGGANSTDLNTAFANTNARMDPRGNPQPTIIMSSQNNTAAIAPLNAGLWAGNLAQSQQVDIIVTDIQEVALLPGDCLRLVNNVLNASFDASWIWRERFLEEAERT